MPRFTISRHDSPRHVHWDLFLEQETALKTWALSQPLEPRRLIHCKLLADHRLAYLDFDGPVSEGRGSVERSESGEYRVLVACPEQWEIELKGAHLHGRLVLTASGPGPDDWHCRLIEAADEALAPPK